MNTKDNWLTTATIHDESRRALWSEVFPGGVVPIKSILTLKVNVPGHLNVDAYMLDLDAITDEQREGLISVISRRFNISYADVKKDIDRGVPILAEGVIVRTRDPGTFFALVDGDDGTEFWDHDEDLSGRQLWEED